MLRENVRISNAGQRLLDNKNLANKVAEAIINGKEKLQNGEPVNVDGLSIKLVTSMDEKTLSTKKG